MISLKKTIFLSGCSILYINKNVFANDAPVGIPFAPTIDENKEASLPDCMNGLETTPSIFNDFPSLSSFIPDHLKDTLPQMPFINNDPFDAITNSLKDFFGGHSPLENIGNLLPSFLGPNSGVKKLRVTVIRIHRKPDFVTHECFMDTITFCRAEMENNDKDGTNECLIKHKNEITKECQNTIDNNKDNNIINSKTIIKLNDNNTNINNVQKQEEVNDKITISESTPLEANNKNQDNKPNTTSSSSIFVIISASFITLVLISGLVMIKKKKKKQNTNIPSPIASSYQPLTVDDHTYDN